MTDAQVMSSTGILPWFGGKRSMAPEIIKLMIGPRALASYDYAVEGCHGSLAWLLALREGGFNGHAIANDLNGILHNLVKVLSCKWNCARLMEQLAVLAHDERTYRGARELLANWSASCQPCAIDIDAAIAYLIDGWMGRKGEHGLEDDFKDFTAGFAFRWTPGGGQNAGELRSMVASIPAWYAHLAANTTFLARDVVAVVNELAKDGRDREQVLVYLDPPYLHPTRGGARYMVDVDDATGGFHEGQDFHTRLAEAANNLRRCTVGVSYYAHERLDHLYSALDGWERIDLSKNKATAQSSVGGGGKAESPEVLYVRRGT